VRTEVLSVVTIKRIGCCAKSGRSLPSFRGRYYHNLSMSKPQKQQATGRVTLNILSQHFVEDILRFFCYVLASFFFCFDRQFYKQTGSMTTGSPQPTSSRRNFRRWRSTGKSINLSAGFSIWVTFSWSDPLDYSKWKCFYDQLNSVHWNITFTIETERDDHLPFPSWALIFTGDMMDLWVIMHNASPTTPTSRRILAPATTHPISKPCFPSWCRGIDRALCAWNSLHNAVPQGHDEATVIDRLIRLLILLRQPFHLVRILPWSPFYPMPSWPSTALGGCWPDISSQLASCQGKFPAYSGWPS
jgi:hypothetical protein